MQNIDGYRLYNVAYESFQFKRLWVHLSFTNKGKNTADIDYLIKL